MEPIIIEVRNEGSGYNKCVWVRDITGAHTACQHTLRSINHLAFKPFKYCPYCGKEIEVAK